ncbi:MAG: hypothetical protein A3C15_01620 [Candidatus Magasanikbacteria bacterium RIFCSPHIGHO2_02_FULL_50_9b]|uniref:Uncharacterized protein n=1 Tax=Candidatus Magasanikbacteria bacterium RIFCSPHIGHO2_02_FULL_50_9b TaxID=1798682 RepID=A0A1F6M8Z8_9BACT|nr:MAG: hypothetical protein A3C15_01620 [Candidatus Magasanikbacteria bacterium RIFCSPHIGHO2_02_FULL_50_9b]
MRESVPAQVPAPLPPQPAPTPQHHTPIPMGQLFVKTAVYEIGPARSIPFDEWGAIIAAGCAACFPGYELTDDDAGRISIDIHGNLWRLPGKAVLIVESPHVLAPVIEVGTTCYALSYVAEIDGNGKEKPTVPAAAG